MIKIRWKRKDIFSLIFVRILDLLFLKNKLERFNLFKKNTDIFSYPLTHEGTN